MSAFDLTGAIIALILSAIGWIAALSSEDRATRLGGFVIAMPSTAWAIFCIARIFGAHL